MCIRDSWTGIDKVDRNLVSSYVMSAPGIAERARRAVATWARGGGELDEHGHGLHRLPALRSEPLVRLVRREVLKHVRKPCEHAMSGQHRAVCWQSKEKGWPPPCIAAKQPSHPP
eukprot:2881649-Rhodomonas_salina.1